MKFKNPKSKREQLIDNIKGWSLVIGLWLFIIAIIGGSLFFGFLKFAALWKYVFGS